MRRHPLAGPRLCQAMLAVALMAAPATGRAQNDSTSDSDSPKPWKLKPPKVFGYVQIHYRYAFSTGADSLVDYDDFRIQRVRVGVKGEAFSWLSYDVEIDPRAPQVTGLLRDAFVEVKSIPRHDLRIGQQKTQFGYENQESSANLFAVNRTEVSDNLSRGVNLRDIGVGLIGNFKVGPKGFRIEDAITLVNGAGMNVQADNTSKKNVWGRLGLRWKQDSSNTLVRLGVSGGIGDLMDEGVDSLDPADDVRLDFRRLGGDLEVDLPWFFLSAEYVKGWDEDPGTNQTEDITGYYVNLVGKTSWRLGPIARYDVLGDEFKRWTFGAYYGLPSERLRVLFNYEYRKLKDGVRADDKLYVWTQVRF